jgi:outer membrane protein TolC
LPVSVFYYMANYFITSYRITSYRFRIFLFAGILFSTLTTHAQNKSAKSSNGVPAPSVPDTSKNRLVLPVTVRDSGNNGVEYLTLRQCIDYAMQHQPDLNKALINIDITKKTNAVSLSGLLPQANASGNLVHYFQSSANASSSNSSNFANSFIPGVSVTQALFNPSLLYAAQSAPLYLKQAEQVTDSTKIFLVSSVSKAFYNVLLTLEQINVLKEDTARLGQSLRDAYHQYKGGIVDETDYEEANITLNNSMAQLKQANENVIPQYAALKQLMGFPPQKQFNVNFDTTEMAQNIHIDTLQQLQYEKRIEYQQIATSKELQARAINYYKLSFLPTVSAFYNYNITYLNNNLPNLFGSAAIPNSLVGLSVSIPIFNGFSRLNNLKKAKLQQQVISWNEVDLKSQIYKEYATALANYKGNYYNLQLLQKNVSMATRVYFVVNLQYKQGIVPYLNVITAESNLISSEISYLNALFQVLSNKIDLQKAMGNISY